MRMLERSPQRDMGISNAFCLVFLDVTSMNHITGSLRNTGVFKSCTRGVIFTVWWRIIISSIQRKLKKWV
jgi:hypothetical protein